MALLRICPGLVSPKNAPDVNQLLAAEKHLR
jgi:hypothetical protein